MIHRPDESERAVVAAVLEFVNADSASEIEQVLRAKQHLLFTDEADRTLHDLIRQYGDNDEDAVTHLRVRRRLLFRCREYGIDRGLAPAARVAPEVEEAVLQLVNLSDILEVRRHIEEHLDILSTPDAEAVLGDLRLSYRDHDAVQERLQQRQQLLETSRRQGVERAFADEMITISAEMNEAIGQLLGTSMSGLRPVLDRYGEMLLTDEAERVLAFMLDAEDSGEGLVEHVRAMLTVLRACRTHGIDAALGPVTATNLSSPADSDRQALEQEAAEELAKIVDDSGFIPEEKLQALAERRPHLAEIIQRGMVTDRVVYAGRLSTTPARSSMETLGAAFDAHDWDRVIELGPETLATINRDLYPELWAIAQIHIGAALSRTPSGDRSANLDDAIEHHLLAREVLPTGGPTWSFNEHHLAMAYSQSGNQEAALVILRNLIAIAGEGRSEPMWHITLANALRDRVAGRHEENLDEAIAQLNLVLSRADLDPHSRRMAMMSLGGVYLARKSGDRADNIEQAIDRLSHTIHDRDRTENLAGWVNMRRALAFAYLDREHGSDLEANWQTALNQLAEINEACPREQNPILWAENQLASSELYRSAPGGPTPADLRRMAQVTESALEVFTLRDHPEAWATVHANLGSIYSWLFRLDEDESAAYDELAIRHLDEAFQVYTRERTPYGWAQVHQALAMVYMRRAELASAGQRWPMARLAVQHFQRVLEVRTVTTDPHGCLAALNYLGAIHFRHQRWYDALCWFVKAMRVTDQLFATAHTAGGQLSAMNTNDSIYTSAAYCLHKLNDIHAAVVCLEWGKSRTLAQALVLRDLDLVGLPEPTLGELRDARQVVRHLDTELQAQLDVGSPNAAETSRRLATARRALGTSLATVRTDNADAVRDRLRFDEIGGTVPSRGAVVIPAITPEGSFIIVLIRDERGHLQLTSGVLRGITTDTLDLILRGTDNHPGWTSQYQIWRDHSLPDEAWRESVRANLELLYQILAAPIKDLLAPRLPDDSPVTIVPQGQLSFLPIHAASAAGDGTDCLLDHYVVSYAPSIYALRASLRRLESRDSTGVNLLVISDPTGDLEFARAEGRHVLAAAAQHNHAEISGTDATLEQVAKAVHGRTHLHFCCHGTYDRHDILRSGLQLSRSALTLDRILDPQFDFTSVRLVTLSACETGLVDMRYSASEFIGLPTAFLQGGACGVISTLWPVNDQATSLLIRSFYHHHLVEGLPPAAALRNAQRWLRDASSTALDAVDRGEAAQAPADAAQSTPDATAETRPFADPYYWAGFQFTGA